MEGYYSKIGMPVINVDALKKAKGMALFTDDIKLPGMLYAKILRSKYPHAKILNIDISKAKKLTGVRAVITGRDCSSYMFGSRIKDKPAFAVDKVRYMGDEVAGVVAVDVDAAEEALELIEVDYEELPSVFDPVEAMQEGAPLVHGTLEQYECAAAFHPIGGSNICNHFKLRHGDIEEGFRQADYIFEDEFKAQPVQHGYIEPLAYIADVDSNGMITIWGSTQSPYNARNTIARGMGVPVSKVRVIVPYVGGGFGGKHFVKGEPACVVMSYLLRKPVKLVFTREEVFTAATVRQPLMSKIRTGVKKDGTIIARKCTNIWDTGAYADIGPAISRNAGMAGAGPYKIPNVWVDSYTVYTNNMVTGSFRGLGMPQATWAIESHMDMIAEQLNINPLKFRLANVLEEGSTIATGQVAHAVGLKKCLECLKEKGNWSKKKQERKKYSGIGIASFHKVTGTPTYQSALIKLNQDASADVLVSAVDLGQGSNTIISQIVAEELGIPVEKIRVSMPDTYVTPWDESTTGSKSTFCVGNAVKRAAEDARSEIFKIASRLLEASVEELELRDGKVLVRGVPDKVIPLERLPLEAPPPYGAKITMDYPGPVMGKGCFSSATEGAGLDPETGQSSKSSVFWMYGAHLAEIEIDSDTGKIEIKQIVAVHNAGKVINPLLAEGQIEGGVVMGIGGTLYEDMILEKGRTLNPCFADYKLPTACDIPEKIECVFVEVPHKEGPYGAMGIGEPPTTGIPAAIGNAVFDAIGVRIKELPITSEKILKALKEKAGRGI